ncbi:MAG TPA: hypothetical protein VHJ34_03975 [Actinomycetota bacterium]|nr:hypothetical protein [Actinomycetota bacterium]
MSSFTIGGTENRMRWDRRARGFVEAWWATVTHADSGAGVWLRYALTAPRASPPYCEVWGFVFDPGVALSFAGVERFPIDRLGAANGRDDGALVRIGDAWLSETHLEGRVSSGARSLSWSLDVEPAARCFHHVPVPLRARAERSASVVCSPNLAVPFTGTVTVDGNELTFAGERGSQSHRWGRRHPASWAWAHCARFDDGADAVFEGVAARACVGPVAAPTTTLLYLRLDGEDVCFNDVRGALRARGRYEMPTWAFSARTDEWKIAGAARAAPTRLVQVAYRDPDGSERFCANSEIADLGVEVYRRGGGSWRHHRSLTSLRGAALEFGRRDPFVELPVVR